MLKCQGMSNSKNLSPPLSLKGHGEGVAFLEPGELEQEKKAQPFCHRQLSHCQNYGEKGRKQENEHLTPLSSQHTVFCRCHLQPKLVGSTGQRCLVMPSVEESSLGTEWDRGECRMDLGLRGRKTEGNFWYRHLKMKQSSPLYEAVTTVYLGMNHFCSAQGHLCDSPHLPQYICSRSQLCKGTVNRYALLGRGENNKEIYGCQKYIGLKINLGMEMWFLERKQTNL